MSEPLFSPDDMEVAGANFGAMCGHGALAAAIGIKVCYVMRYFKQGGWINIPMMKEAIIAAGWTCRKADGPPPTGRAVIMVQFLGLWMDAAVPIGAKYAHRHWIAVREGQFWDANFPGWMSPEQWAKRAPSLYSAKTTGHEFAGIYSIKKGFQ